MSSNHTRVSSREWEEINRNIAQTDAYVIAREQEARRLQQESEARIREIARQHEQTMRQLDSAVDSLANTYRDAMAQARQDFSRDLQADAAAFRGQFRDLAAQLQSISGRLSTTDSRVEALAQQFSAAIQARISSIADTRERALAVEQQLDALMAQMEALSPRQFLPREYAGLETLRSSVAAGIRAGDYQAAITVSQSSLLAASRLLTRLTLENTLYQNQLADVRTAAARLRERFAYLGSEDGMLRVAMAEEQLELEYNIDYWSGGAFSALEQEFAQLQQQLNAGTLTPEQLADVRARLEQLDARLSDCDQSARKERAASVFVEDTAVRLHDCLSQRGWELTDSGHHNDEEREPYAMEYTDGNGNTVSIVVSPGEKTEEPIYAVEVYGEDHYRASVIKEGLHASMEAEGLRIGGIERRDDCHLNPTPEAFRQNMVEEARRRRRKTTCS